MGITKQLYEQALTDLKNANVDGGLEDLKQVNHQAKRARSHKGNIENTILMTTKLLVLSDVLLASSIQSDSGTIIIPPSGLISKQRQDISTKIQAHYLVACKKLDKKRGNIFICV